MPENDEYIIAAPIKLGIDWSPKRIQDVVNDIQSNMKINIQSNYLQRKITKVNFILVKKYLRKYSLKIISLITLTLY